MMQHLPCDGWYLVHERLEKEGFRTVTDRIVCWRIYNHAPNFVPLIALSYADAMIGEYKELPNMALIGLLPPGAQVFDFFDASQIQDAREKIAEKVKGTGFAAWLDKAKKKDEQAENED